MEGKYGGIQAVLESSYRTGHMNLMIQVKNVFHLQDYNFTS